MKSDYTWDYMKKYRSDMNRLYNIKPEISKYMSGKVAELSCV
jgi:hypothetical protein